MVIALVTIIVYTWLRTWDTFTLGSLLLLISQTTTTDSLILVIINESLKHMVTTVSENYKGVCRKSLQPTKVNRSMEIFVVFTNCSNDLNY